MPKLSPSSRLLNWVWWYAPPVLWAALIFALSAQQVLPGLSLSGLDFLSKKLAHITVYAVLYWLIWRSCAHTWPTQASTHPTRWLLPLVITLLYALTDELHQTTVPGRTGTLRDFGFDFLGAGIAYLRKYRYI